MVFTEMIKSIMQEEQVTQSELAKRCGFKHQSSVSEIIKRDMKISNVVKFLNVLGYDLIVRSREENGKEYKC